MITKKWLFDSTPQVKKNKLPQYGDENQAYGATRIGRFPPWLHRSMPKGGGLWQTGEVIHSKRLYTVCEEAKCPNLVECWSQKTATFLVLGKTCTRACGFCAIGFANKLPPPDPQEAAQIVESIRALGLCHVVITMVARDDLEDGGAHHIAQIVQEIKKNFPEITIELLTSDFQGNKESLKIVLSSCPDIFNHNIETVRELTPRVRHKAQYDRTLSVLAFAHEFSSSILVKSGFMVGLGESKEAVLGTMKDLKAVGCHILTIGQYLQADIKKLMVKRFVPPDEFKEYVVYGESIGLDYVYAGPFVRSSYNAKEVLLDCRRKKRPMV